MKLGCGHVKSFVKALQSEYVGASSQQLKVTTLPSKHWIPLRIVCAVGLPPSPTAPFERYVGTKDTLHLLKLLIIADDHAAAIEHPLLQAESFMQTLDRNAAGEIE